MTIFKDIRLAIRSLLKKPGFTIVTVITLALGIGEHETLYETDKRIQQKTGKLGPCGRASLHALQLCANPSDAPMHSRNGRWRFNEALGN